MCCDDGCVNECTWYCGSKSPLRGFLLRLMVTNLPPSPLPPSPLTLSLPSPRAWCAAMSTCLRCFLRNASEPVREPRPRNPLPPRCAATWTKQEKNFDICFFCICTSYADRVLLLTSYFIEVDVRVLHHPTHTYLRRPTWLLDPTCAIGHSVTPRYFLHRAIQVLTPTCCVPSPHCCISYFLLLVPAPQSLLAHATWLHQHRSCRWKVPAIRPAESTGGCKIMIKARGQRGTSTTASCPLLFGTWPHAGDVAFSLVDLWCCESWKFHPRVPAAARSNGPFEMGSWTPAGPYHMEGFLKWVSDGIWMSLVNPWFWAQRISIWWISAGILNCLQELSWLRRYFAALSKMPVTEVLMYKQRSVRARKVQFLECKLARLCHDVTWYN